MFTVVAGDAGQTRCKSLLREKMVKVGFAIFTPWLSAAAGAA